MTRSSLPGIILAAGRSRRMGENKLLLHWQGKPILQHVVDAAARSSLTPLLLVVDPKNQLPMDQIAPGPCRLIHSRGTVYSDSLRAGLRALDPGYAGAMFLLGDQPLVRTETLERLITAFRAEPGRWVAPSWQGRRGNPVIAPASWFARILALKGDTGPRQYLGDPKAHLKLVAVEDEGVIFDIDSPADYERLQKIRHTATT